MFLKPQRKKNHCLSRFHKKVVLNVPITRIQEIYTNEIRLWIADNEIAETEIQRIDEIGYQTVLKNNNIWFKNNLSEDIINEYFRRNLDTSAISVMINPAGAPKMMFNGRSVADFGELIATAYRAGGPIGLWASVKLELQGLVFYPKMFGTRWVLREIDILPEDPREIDRAAIESDVLDSRGEIEDHWTAEVRQKIADLEGLLARIKSVPAMNGEWNNMIRELRQKL